ncbi:hypothetical protein [Bradyrhizobium sp. 170]|uniref:hypothetical protein n=1 Tax=Bradyrhizobium sp. 170 TaxID=2782641 RepID=UPI001FFE3053|nr:hypothetical protein [Bradyrhizobium sp. 170]
MASEVMTPFGRLCLKAADFAASSTVKSASWVRRLELSDTSIGSIRPVLSPRSGTADLAGSLPCFMPLIFTTIAATYAAFQTFLWT